MSFDMFNFDLGTVDIRKTVADAGYVAVGIGVIAFQQAQVRRRELQKRLAESGGCLPVVGQVVDQLKTVVTRAA